MFILKNTRYFLHLHRRRIVQLVFQISIFEASVRTGERQQVYHDYTLSRSYPQAFLVVYRQGINCLKLIVQPVEQYPCKRTLRLVEKQYSTGRSEPDTSIQPVFTGTVDEIALQRRNLLARITLETPVTRHVQVELIDADAPGISPKMLVRIQQKPTDCIVTQGGNIARRERIVVARILLGIPFHQTTLHHAHPKMAQRIFSNGIDGRLDTLVHRRTGPELRLQTFG